MSRILGRLLYMYSTCKIDTLCVFDLSVAVCDTTAKKQHSYSIQHKSLKVDFEVVQ
jgi:hypothetical protein